MSVFVEIGGWFEKRNPWEQHVYELLLSRSDLTDKTREKLADACEEEASKGKRKGIKLQCTEPEPEPADQVTRLLCVKDARNVNNLAPDQTLQFSSTGLTIVYGDNGAGKTGYGRILRQVCRSRGAQPLLLSNIFSPPAEAYSAEIRFSVDDREDSILLKGGLAPKSAFHNFSIFDSKAAVALIDQENVVAFRPFGLDILDAYTTLLDEIRQCLQKRLDAISIPLVDATQIPEETAAGKFLRKLDSPESERELERLAVPLSEDQSIRLKMLKEIEEKLRSNDPKKLAGLAKAQATRFTTLSARLARINQVLGSEAIKRLIALRDDTSRAKQIQEDIRTKAFNMDKLGGIGSDTWTRLWTAAREFSDLVAAKNGKFPNPTPGTVCVLCAQPIDLVAAERFETLEAFVKATTEGEATAFQTKTDKAITFLQALNTVDDQDDALIAELESEHPACAGELKQYLEVALQLQTAAITHLKDGIGLPGVSPLPTEPSALALLIEAANRKSDDYEKISKQPQNDDHLREIAELEGIQRLFGLKTSVVAEIQRLKRIGLLKKAISLTSTAPITKFSGELTAKHVTEALCMRFDEEIRSLSLDRIGVRLAPLPAKKGNARHRLEFVKSQQTANLRDVISEGEYRSLALASFLAEIGGNQSGVLFDDPISSLDHIRRERIATRLAREAKTRQVIVFTHDIVFLNLLWDAGTKDNVSVAAMTLERRGGAGTGFCVKGVPWRGMKTKERSKELQLQLAMIELKFETGDIDYEKSVRHWYGLLREAWEHAIEELLFNDAINRYRRSIETKRLKKALAAVENEDYDIIDNAIGRCSGFLPGHDDAAESNPPIPEPADCKSDFKVFSEWTQRRIKAVN